MDRISLNGESRKSLMELARNMKIRGRSGLTKSQLIDVILLARENAETPDVGNEKTAVEMTAGSEMEKNKADSSPMPLHMRDGGISYMQGEVEDSKYYTGVNPTSQSDTEYNFPEQYEENRLVLMTVDPLRLHAYWEINRQTIEVLRAEIGDRWNSAHLTLRVYDLSRSDSFFDIPIAGGADNWYISIPRPGHYYRAEIGVEVEDRFKFIVCSNATEAPSNEMSDVLEERWTPDWEAPEEVVSAEHEEQGYTAEEVYALSGGFDVHSSSVDLRKALQEHFERELSSGIVSSFSLVSSPGLFSPGISSWSLPNLSSFSGGISSIGGSESLAARGKGRNFWYMLDAELIIYGATEPDASVTLQGQPLHLRPDGTFTVRFALPDGFQDIPVVFESADKIDKGVIEPKISRNTEYNDG